MAPSPALSDQGRVLLDEVRERPDEDGPRQILSDWLTDQGDPRGEFIQVQLLRARLPQDDPAQGELRRRERVLLCRHAFSWLGPFADLARSWRFERGFLVLEARAGKLLEGEGLPPACLDVCPWVEGLILSELRPQHPLALPWCPLVPALTWLDLSRNALRLGALTRLLSTHCLAALTRLSLAGCGLGHLEASALADHPHLKRLTFLDLTDNQIGDEGAASLANAKHLPCLRTVLLGGNGISIDGLALLRARFGDGVLHGAKKEGK